MFDSTIDALTPITVLVAFAFGAVSFISPCVLPLVPGYLSLMSGYSVRELAEGESSTRRMIRVTLLFVAGFTVVFLVLGATATGLGRAFQRNKDDLLTIAGFFVIAMGLFLAVSAVWTPRFLLPVMREHRLEVRPSRLGSWAPPLMGVAFGFGWTPCIGPTLGSILTIAAASGRLVEGLALLFAYSLGLGLPFLLAALATDRVVGGMAALRRYLRPIGVASGVALAGFGVLMVTGGVTDLSIWFQQWLSRIGLDRLARI